MCQLVLRKRITLERGGFLEAALIQPLLRRAPPCANRTIEYELKETERLNAMIVKQTRHCAELKAWEEAEEARRRT